MAKIFTLSNQKTARDVYRQCWSLVREYHMLSEKIDYLDDEHLVSYLLSRITHIRYMLDNYFHEDITESCREMWFMRRDAHDEYEGHRWVHWQAFKKWGAGIDVLIRGLRVEELFGNWQDISF